ncbi:MAG: hypothetical protein ACI8PT_001822 [Gammaproteobacteria bacterium]|jgi:hypothetical protein
MRYSKPRALVPAWTCNSTIARRRQSVPPLPRRRVARVTMDAQVAHRPTHPQGAPEHHSTRSALVHWLFVVRVGHRNVCIPSSQRSLTTMCVKMEFVPYCVHAIAPSFRNRLNLQRNTMSCEKLQYCVAKWMLDWPHRRPAVSGLTLGMLRVARRETMGGGGAGRAMRQGWRSLGPECRPIRFATRWVRRQGAGRPRL